MCIYPVYTLTFVISLNWFIIDNVQCAGTSIQCHKQSLCFVCNKIEKKRYKLLKVVKALMFSCFNLKILRWHINVKWPILMSFISFGDVGGNIGHRVCLYSVHTHTHTYAPRVIIEDKWSTAPRRHVCIGSSNLVASTSAFLSLSLSPQYQLVRARQSVDSVTCAPFGIGHHCQHWRREKAAAWTHLIDYSQVTIVERH